MITYLLVKLKIFEGFEGLLVYPLALDLALIALLVLTLIK